MNTKPFVGQRVKLNRFGSRQVFNTDYSSFLTKTVTITSVSDESLTYPEDTWSVEVDNPILNQYLIDNWCFDSVTER